MKAYITGLTSAAPSTTATNYGAIVLSGALAWGTSEVSKQIVVPHSMTLDRLRVTFTNAPGAGKNRAFTVMVNGVAAALTCTVSGTGTTAQDLTNTISLSAGDRISLRTVPTGTPTAPGTTYWTIRQDATDLFGVIGLNAGPPTGTTNYVAPQNQTNISSTDALGQIIIPTAGVFKNLVVRSVDQAPGSGKSWAITLMKNGVAQSLAATISNTSQQINDGVNTVSVVAGDVVSFRIVPSGTPAVSAISYAMSFDPTVDGESFIAFSGNGIGPSNTVTQYAQVNGGDNAWNATEANRYSRLAACTLKGMYIQTSVSPGASPKAYAFTTRVEAADTTSIVTINDASTTVGSTRMGGITGQNITINDDNRVTIKSVPTSTPASLFVKSSLLLYITPPVIVSQVKNVNGVAQSSIKKVDGLDINSVKKLAGISNT